MFIRKTDIVEYFELVDTGTQKHVHEPVVVWQLGKAQVAPNETLHALSHRVTLQRPIQQLQQFQLHPRILSLPSATESYS